MLYGVRDVGEAVRLARPRSANGLEATYEDFFSRYADELVRIAYLMTGDLADAQDLAQEALVRVWRKWARVSTYDQPEAFARRVLHNLVIGRWRKQAGAPRPEIPAYVPAPSVEHLDVLAALASLPPRQRSAIVLHDLIGLDAVEIGRQIGARPGTVRQWLRRGRSRLAAVLEEGGSGISGGEDAER